MLDSQFLTLLVTHLLFTEDVKQEAHNHLTFLIGYFLSQFSRDILFKFKDSLTTDNAQWQK